MMFELRTYIKYFILSLLLANGDSYKEEKFDLFMPAVKPKADAYLCTPVKIDPDESYFIVGFEPKASMRIAHHIIVYGCASPGKSQSVWNCGEMANDNSIEEDSTPCSEESTVIYAWGRDAPQFILPEGVGFKVGRDTSINYLVLQVHYANHHHENELPDSSGVYLRYTKRPLNKLAGVLLMGTAGMIPAYRKIQMQTACDIQENKILHPFAFRTHTHVLGRKVSGYRVRRINGKDEWTLLGSHDPMEPQMFYPINEDIPLKIHDKVAASCLMQSNRSTDTKIGTTSKDEMCNFYLMYWVENSEEPLERKFCFTAGPPYYQWNLEFRNLPPSTDEPRD